MEEPLTDELLRELLDSPDVRSYIEGSLPPGRTLSAYLQQLLAEHGLRQSEVVGKLLVSGTYGWQVFTGGRANPSRDVVLQIVLAMGLSLQEANRVLQTAGKSALYCKDRRDAIIIFCLDRGATLQEANDALYRFGERTIGGEGDAG